MMQQNEAELISKAEGLIENSNLEEAKSLLLEILKSVNSQSYDALNDLSVIMILENNFTLALEYIRQVFAIDPQNEVALGNLDYINQIYSKESANEVINREAVLSSEQNISTSDETKIQKVKKHWDSVSNTRVSYNLRWWGSPTIWNHYNRLISGDESGLIQLLKQKLNGRVLGKGISVGCGIGVTEMKLIQEGIVSHFDLYELSEVRINKGLERAKELNILNRIDYHNEDVFSCIKDDSYDLVYWYDALHHMFDVDYTVKWCKQILKNEGIFCMNEYTGPSRFQFSDKTLEIATAIRNALPDKYFFDPRNGNQFSRICYRPSASALAKDDPSEAADSGRIIESVIKYFPQAEIKKLGGIVYMRVLDDIICNFNENDLKDLQMLKALLDIDKALIQFPDVDNLYSAAVAQKTTKD